MDPLISILLAISLSLANRTFKGMHPIYNIKTSPSCTFDRFSIYKLEYLGKLLRSPSYKPSFLLIGEWFEVFKNVISHIN